QDGQTLADLRAGEAADRQEGDEGADLLGQRVGDEEAGEEHHQDDVDRERHDADAYFDELPPALRPEAGRLGLAGQGFAGRRHRLLRFLSFNAGRGSRMGYSPPRGPASSGASAGLPSPRPLRTWRKG